MNRQLRGIIAATLALGTLVPTAFASTATHSREFRAQIGLDGKVITSPYAVVANDGSNNTTYMPIYYITEVLKKVGYTIAWNGHTWTLTSKDANLDLSNITVGTGNTSIVVNGKVVKKVNSIVMKDPAGGKHAVETTYLPIYYVQPLLEALGVKNTWNGTKWEATSPISLAAEQTYGPKTGSTTVNKNMLIEGTGVVVQNTKVNGNIYVNPGADGTVHLDNVSVTGSIVILSGADHSIYLNNVQSPNLEINSSSSVHVVTQGNTSIGTTTIPSVEKSNVILDQQSGSLGDVSVGASSSVTLSGTKPFKNVKVTGASTVQVSSNTTITNLSVSGSSSKINIDSGATVSTLDVDSKVSSVNITNNGTISTLANHGASSSVNVSGTGQVKVTQGNAPTGGTTGTSGSTGGSTGSTGGYTGGTGGGYTGGGTVSNPLPDITTLSVGLGSSPGTTLLTGTLYQTGDSLKVVVGSESTTRPNVGDSVPGSAATYSIGTDLTASAGQYVDVYEVNLAGTVVAFHEFLLKSADINNLSGKDAALYKLVTQLNLLHSALQSTGGLSAVRVAEGKAQSADWTQILYGTDTPSIPNVSTSDVTLFTTTVQKLVSIATYGSLSQDTSTTSGNVHQILTEVQKLDPSITGTDLYNFFENFKKDMLVEAVAAKDSSSTTSGTSIVSQALEDAVNQTTDGTTKPFVGLLSKYGLSVSDLADVWARAQAIDPNKDALNAVTAAVGSMEFVPQNKTNFAVGDTTQYTLTLNSSAPDGLGGISIPNSQFTWTSSDPAVATVDADGNVTAVAGGTATITASLHGYPVDVTDITVAGKLGSLAVDVNGVQGTYDAYSTSSGNYISLYDFNQILKGLGLSATWDTATSSLTFDVPIGYQVSASTKTGTGSDSIYLNSTLVKKDTFVIAKDSNNVNTTWVPEQDLAAVISSIGGTFSATGLTWTVSAGPNVYGISVEPGSKAGTTKLTGTLDAKGDTLSVAVGASAETNPGVGGAAPSSAMPYTLGADIPATAGDFVSVYELDSNGKVVGFHAFQLSSGDIALTNEETITVDGNSGEYPVYPTGSVQYVSMADLGDILQQLGMVVNWDTTTEKLNVEAPNTYTVTAPSNTGTAPESIYMNSNLIATDTFVKTTTNGINTTWVPQVDLAKIVQSVGGSFKDNGSGTWTISTGTLASPVIQQVKGTQVSWNAVPGADSYDVQVIDSQLANLVADKQVQATSADLYDLGIPAGDYYVSVVASGNGATPSQPSIAVPFSLQGLLPPTGVAITGTDVTWNSVPGATKYEVDVEDSNKQITAFYVDTNSFDLSLNGIVGGNYNVSVMAMGSGYGESDPSSSVPVTLKALPTPTISVDQTNPTLVTWAAVTGATDYQVNVTDAQGNVTEYTTSGDTNFDLSLQGLQTGTYTVTVQAEGEGFGDSVPSNSVSVNMTSLPAPTNVTWDGSSTLSWDSVTGAQGYLVSLEDAQGNTVWSADVWSTSINLLQYGAPSGSYSVVVQAGTDGTGTLSKPVSVTLPGPAAPTNVTLSNNTVVSWDSMLNADMYTVEVLDSTGNIVNSFDTANTSMNLALQGLQSGTYNVDVFAYNYSTWGTYRPSPTTELSSTVTVKSTGTLSAPTNVAVDTTKQNTLTWSPVANASGYKVTLSTSGNGGGTTFNVTNPYIDFGSSDYPFLTGGSYTATVQAMGVGTTYADSAASGSVDISLVALAQPVINTPSGTAIAWAPVTNALAYSVAVFDALGNQVRTVNTTGTSIDLSQLGLMSGHYTVKVTAENAIGSWIDSPQSQASASVTVDSNGQLTAPTVQLNSDGTTLNWGAVNHATSYQVTVQAPNTYPRTYSTTGTSFNLAAQWLQTGTYTATVSSSGSENNYQDSQTSNAVTVTIKGPDSPVANVTGTTVTWQSVTGANGYLVELDDASTGYTVTQIGVDSSTTSEDFSNAGVASGTYTAKVVAYTNTNNTFIESTPSAATAPFTIQSTGVLETPTNLSVPSGTTLTWSPVASAGGYDITVEYYDSNGYMTRLYKHADTNQVDLSTFGMPSGTTALISVSASGMGTSYTSSEPSADYLYTFQ